MRAAGLLALALVGCGSGEQAPPAADANQIEALSTPDPVEPEGPDPAKLEPLNAADLGSMTRGCRFAAGNQILVSADAGGAATRTAAGLRHLVSAAPVSATGGFFEDRQLSISIGRDESDAGAPVRGRPAPARMIVTNRRSGTEQRVIGLWGCDQ